MSKTAAAPTRWHVEYTDAAGHTSTSSTFGSEASAQRRAQELRAENIRPDAHLRGQFNNVTVKEKGRPEAVCPNCGTVDHWRASCALGD